MVSGDFVIQSRARKADGVGRAMVGFHRAPTPDFRGGPERRGRMGRAIPGSIARQESDRKCLENKGFVRGPLLAARSPLNIFFLNTGLIPCPSHPPEKNTETPRACAPVMKILSGQNTYSSPESARFEGKQHRWLAAGGERICPFPGEGHLRQADAGSRRLDVGARREMPETAGEPTDKRLLFLQFQSQGDV